MCGLFGIASLNNLSEFDVFNASSARDKLSHRGPDHGDCWVSDNIYIGHRRLSIIDTSSLGNQPMSSGNVTITVNGEIYNFKKLRRELELSGCVFTSNSDSEVILHGFNHWGLKTLCNKLDGMYVAVIFDHSSQRLNFIRDRVGIKPLYYYLDNERLIWSSELKAIVDFISPQECEIDPEAVVDFLAYRFIPAPKTVYKNVYKLCAATVFEIDLRSFESRLERYWYLNTAEIEAEEDQIAKKLLALLRESVHQQLVSDVPIGLLLSGGVDSSAVAALATERQKLRSFSIGFGDANKDETPYALAMAQHVKSEHDVHYATDDEIVALSAELPKWFDEPFGDTSSIPTWLVCNLAKSNLKVVLSGDGGDELFGGYKWYLYYSKLREVQKWFPLKSRQGYKFPRYIPKYKLLELLSISDPVVLYARLRKGLADYQLRDWMKRLGVATHYDPYWAYRQCYDESLSNRKAAQVMDFHTYLPDDILVKVDRVSMNVALECRPVFLSKKLVDFAFSLPETFHYRGKTLKGGLKLALRGVLPATILNRSKQGFSLPNSGWKHEVRDAGRSMQEKLLESFFKYIGRSL